MRRKLGVVIALFFFVAVAGSGVWVGPVVACSVPVVPPGGQVVRFAGRAVGHELRIEQGFGSTYDWTFSVTSWSRSSAGFRRRAGALVTISAVESPAVPPTTLPLPPGAVPNSCFGVKLGITTEFHRGLVYDVTAAIHSGPPIEYLVSVAIGSIRKREH